MTEEVVLAVAPPEALAHRPLARQPHAGLIGQPAVAVQLPDDEIDARHALRPANRIRRLGPFLDLEAQAAARRLAQPRVQVPRILLPQELVAELLGILRRGPRDVIPGAGQRDEAMADVGRQPRGTACSRRPHLVASGRVSAAAEYCERGVRCRLPAGDRRGVHLAVADEVREIAEQPGDLVAGLGGRQVIHGGPAGCGSGPWRGSGRRCARPE